MLHEIIPDSRRVHYILSDVLPVTNTKPARLVLKSFRFPGDREVLSMTNLPGESVTEHAAHVLKEKGYTVLSDGEGPDNTHIFGVAEFVKVKEMRPVLSPDGQPQPRKIEIIGREWFRKSAGNSYQTATIYIDDEHFHDLPQFGGYGDHYIEAAAAYLESVGRIPRREYYPASGGRTPVWQHFQDLKIDFKYHKTEVPRERDL